MTTMISEVYEAFLAAGVDKDKARAAAEALASEQLATKQDMRDLKAELGIVKAELAIVKWIISGIGFGVLLLVIRSFWPA